MIYMTCISRFVRMYVSYPLRIKQTKWWILAAYRQESQKGSETRDTKLRKVNSGCILMCSLLNTVFCQVGQKSQDGKPFWRKSMCSWWQGRAQILAKEENLLTLIDEIVVSPTGRKKLKKTGRRNGTLFASKKAVTIHLPSSIPTFWASWLYLLRAIAKIEHQKIATATHGEGRHFYRWPATMYHRVNRLWYPGSELSTDLAHS